VGGGAGAGVDMARGGLPPLLAGGTFCGVATATGLLTRAGWVVWWALRCLISVVGEQIEEYADN